MQETLTLSRGSLNAFLVCQRRYQLRYRQRLPWPVAPADDKIEAARILGQRFHQLLHRHFLGLPVTEELAVEPRLSRWWEIYLTEGPKLPDGHLYPEITLSVPIAGHLLTGRIDLLVIDGQQARIVDWKTENRPSTTTQLTEDLQTRVYMGLVTEGAKALEQPIDPDRLTLTYWYVNAPADSVELHYSREWHKENWAYLGELVTEVDRQLDTGETLPLTSDLAECGRCAYQIYCGRIMKSINLAEWESDVVGFDLEPDAP